MANINTTASVLVVQHVACETLGTIEHSLPAQSLASFFVRVYEGDEMPSELGDTAGLIVMGGPMSVYESDRLPHLKLEMRLIESALKAERPVLGICLGSQLLAHVLGSKVYAGTRKEIGWHAVTLSEAAHADPLWATVPQSFPAFHWHGDVFDLPQNAVKLASSDLTTHQAFRSGNAAYGILFHLEVTGPIISKIAATFPDDVQHCGGDARQLAVESSKYLPQLTEVGRKVFDSWAKLVTES
jgi:GMP synthase (glutamine-hydrolysing)